MSVQLLNIVVWNADGEMRTISLMPGKLNIITGGSSTGKSALIDIVDYCMGAGECRVPGVIRRTVEWYGIRLTTGKQQLFVARRAPHTGAKASSEIYIRDGATVDIPDFANLHGATNTEGLEQLLTRRTGISPNRSIPPERSTRDDLEANVRHSLKFCFQPQYEIASRSILFHRQSEPFMAQAIIDTLPYFLGAVQEDYLSRQAELRRTRRQLKRAERNLKEIKSLSAGGMEQGLRLLVEAQNVGLLPEGPNPKTRTELESVLAKVYGWQPELPAPPANVTTVKLQSELAELERTRFSTFERIRAIRAFARQVAGYSEQAAEQRLRLESIQAIDSAIVNTRCPLCENPIAKSTPSLDEVRASFDGLSRSLEKYEADRPDVEDQLAQYEAELLEIENQIVQQRRAILTVRAQDARSLQSIGITTAQAFVAGRVQLYLESVFSEELSDADGDDVDSLRLRLAKLESDLNEHGVARRVDAQLVRASIPMKRWAKELELEYGSSDLRIEWQKLTIIADTADGELPLAQMGSGKNWVGYHLLGHFALHQEFVRRQRPVPRFLFLDQPTQVFYPPERDQDGKLDHLKDEDSTAVHRMFEWVHARVEELNGDFQVIVTDHADINEPYFQSAIVEKWRGDRKLIPASWL